MCKIMDIHQKLNDLKDNIKSLENIVVAFSGGVDSTFLLRVCIDVLGRKNVLALIGVSPLFPQREIEEAVNLSEMINAEYFILETSEMKNPDFIQNNRSRCYLCKTHFFERAREIAEQRGFIHVAEGSNLDDLDDFRPGRKACIEQRIRSPLLEAGLTKIEIRSLSAEYSLPTYDKPSFACLLSRIPYGVPVSIDILRKIERSEEFIHSIGIRQVRVRYHGNIARIEVMANDFETVMSNRVSIIDRLGECGFSYVTLDLKGYKTGSMNI